MEDRYKARLHSSPFVFLQIMLSFCLNIWVTLSQLALTASSTFCDYHTPRTYLSIAKPRLVGRQRSGMRMKRSDAAVEGEFISSASGCGG